MKLDKLFAAIFLILFLLDIYAFTSVGQLEWQLLFWACNNVALFLAFAFFYRSKFVFTSIASLLFIPQLFWIVDFFVRLSGTTFLGVTDYLFVPDYPVLWFILSLKHLLLPFIAVWAVYKYGFDKNGWKGAIGYGVILWLLGIIFNSAQNINCAYRNCITAIPIPDLAWITVYPIIMLGIIWLQYSLLKKYFSAKP